MLDFNGKVGVAFKLSATDDTDFAVLHNQSLRSALDWSGCSLRHYLCLICSDLVRFSKVRDSGTIFIRALDWITNASVTDHFHLANRIAISYLTNQIILMRRI